MNFSKQRLPDFFFGAVFTSGLLVCIASVLPYLARLHWFLDVFSHFRLQFACCILLAILLILCSKRKKLSLVFLPFLLLTLSEIVPFYFPLESGEGTDLKVVLCNVNSSTGDPDRVLAYLKEGDADVVVIQEFSSRWVKLQEALREDYPYQMAEVREDNFGMALLSRRPFVSEEVFFFTDEILPSLGVELMHEGQKIFLLATHPMPPVDKGYTDLRDRQLAEIASFLGDSGGPVILVGDLNTSPWSPVFKDLVVVSGLQNSMQGFGVQPTWPSFIPLLWTPLDHLLHSDDFAISARRIGPSNGSDHFPLEVILKL
ncbi:endonuclease/exonuclease/phosphatase family protein [Kiritimatiellota bacterium B12222]|nr:endonuclease/exonuclease/phosphatase family protein [Kiritimatiellota bacterium B12222]